MQFTKVIRVRCLRVDLKHEPLIGLLCSLLMCYPLLWEDRIGLSWKGLKDLPKIMQITDLVLG